MIPIRDENPTHRTPVATYALLLALGVVWIFVQGAGLDEFAMAASVCNLGVVPGEITGLAPEGFALPMGEGVACLVDREPINVLTPITSMFLHGGWAHLLGNALFLWIFGDNIEDSMGRLRFVLFYLICGIAAAAAQIMIHPSSPVPMVGASGAISGVLGGYLRLFPRVRVHVLVFIFFVIELPAWMMLLWWFGLQLLSGLPQLTNIRPDVASGVAVWAHIGGFAAGFLLVKWFARDPRMAVRRVQRPTYRWG